MLSVNSLPRSSLEEMLDSLQRTDKKEKPKDEPPVLPARPKPSSRARLPSPKGPLPTSFEIVDLETDSSLSNCIVKKEDMQGLGQSTFGLENVKEGKPENVSRKSGQELKADARGNGNQANLPSESLRGFRESKGDGNAGYITKEIVGLENARKQVLQGTLIVQKCFRGYSVRRDFEELKRGIVTLQSYIRSEIARKHIGLLRLRKSDVCKKLAVQHLAVVQIQSVIRGLLVRRHFNHLWNSKQSNVGKHKPGSSISAVKDLPPEMLPSVVDELQKRVLEAEATLRRKERENECLREQVQQFEARWLECESKVKSMEQMWEKQMASFQMSLTVTKNSLGGDDTITQPGNDESEVKSLAPPTPCVIQFSSNSNDAKSRRDIDDGLCLGSSCVEEFEQRKLNDDEVQEIAEVKSGQSTSRNLGRRLWRLKPSFVACKKCFKFRLPKTQVPWPRHSIATKHCWKCWGRKVKRS